MTQQPFSRPGAIDLSALKKPAPAAPSSGGRASSAGGGGGSAYSLTVTEENFQQVIESSMTAPVLLAFYSASRLPESEQMARDLASAVDAHEGRFLAALVDVDATPAIAQAVQLQSIPYLMAVLDGRPQPIAQDVLGPEEISGLLDQLAQQLTAGGVTGRHQPRAAAPATEEGEEPGLDPRYAPAQDALAAGDIDRAVEEYQKLVSANPADSEAVAGRAMAKVLQRTPGVDLQAARAAAAADPDDIDAQTLCADLDMLGGHVEDAFVRLVELVRRTSDKERERARDHLLGLFAAVGNDDPRVLNGRRALASALF